MRPRRTVKSNFVFTLEGGTEDNDLWATIDRDDQDFQTLTSVWVPTAEERERIARGENIELVVWGTSHPAIAMNITDVPLGRPKEDPDAQ